MEVAWRAVIYLARDNQTKGFVLHRAMFNLLGPPWWRKPSLIMRCYSLSLFVISLLNIHAILRATVSVEIVDDRSLAEVADNLIVLLTFCSGLTKLALFYTILGGPVARMIRYFEEMPHPSDERPGITSLILYGTQLVCTGGGWVLNGVLTKDLLWAGDFLWDTKTSYGRLLGIGIQITSAQICVLQHISIDSLPNVCVAIISRELKILKSIISDFGVRTENNKAVIKEAVDLHVAILRGVHLMNEAYRFIFGYQVLYMVFHLCVIFFTIVTVSDTSYLITSVGTMMISALSQLFMYCHAGQRLTSEMEELKFCCYSSRWYEAPPHQRQWLCSIMEVAKRPVLLHSFRIVTASFVTFQNSVRESISYYVFLRTVSSNMERGV